MFVADKMKIKKAVWTGAIIVLFMQVLYAQKTRKDEGGNLPKFYKQRIHFGFSLGVNQTDFRVHTIPNSKFYTNFRDTVNYPYDTLNLKSIRSKPDPGFTLGIISDLRLHEYLRLRFLPNLAFGSRTLEYSFTGTDTFVVKRRVESTFVNLPLQLKLQSKRVGNFGAYVLGGGTYSIDLASNKKAKASNDVVRIKPHDWLYEAGGGADFYLQYFKLALELKVVVGVKNLIIKDGTIFSTPIEKLNSRIFVFSITFEG